MKERRDSYVSKNVSFAPDEDIWAEVEGKTMPPPEFELTAHPLGPIDQEPGSALPQAANSTALGQPQEESRLSQIPAQDQSSSPTVQGAAQSPEAAPDSAAPDTTSAETESAETEVAAPVIAAPVAAVPQSGAVPAGEEVEESESVEMEGQAQAEPAADAGAENPNGDAGAGAGGDAGAGNGGGGNAGAGNGNGAGGGEGEGGGGDIGGGGMTPFEAQPAALDTSDSGALVRSLATQQPTTMVATMPEVGSQLPAAQEGDQTQAESYLPEVMQPTGLSSTEEEAPAVEAELPATQEPALQPQSDGTEQEVATDHPEPQAQLPTDRIARQSNQTLQQPGALRNAINSIPTEDGAVDTSAGPRPQVELTGEANPQLNQTAQSEADASVGDAEVSADQETHKDFGEKGILPAVTPELMTVQQELTAPEAWQSKGNEGLPEMDAQLAAAVDAGILSQHQDELNAEMEKQVQAQTEFDTNAQAERDKGLADIEAENERVKQLQLAERERGEAEVQGHREEWQAQNEQVMADFDKSSADKRAQVEGDIQAKVAETDAKVEREYAAAEQKAQNETVRAQNEVEAKKREAKEKENDKSWWDSVCDAVGDFFAALKEAVSAIFDALRAAVSAIIEGAKKLAGALIDMARDAIKGLISAFAEALKAFVKLALAAFPELAEKFCQWIDAAVEAMHKAIDALAEGLKAAVNALLDLVGAAINAILDAYEAYINAILDVLEALTVGFLRVMEGIANLGSAAYESPDHFLGQVSEEMLGSDVTQPLPNEYAAGAESAAPVAESVAASIPGDANISQPDAMTDVPAVNESPDADATLLSRQRYTEEDFQMPVASGEEFDQDLMAEVATLPEGEHELAVDGGEDKGIEALKADILGGASQPSEAETADASASPEQTPESSADGAAPQVDNAPSPQQEQPAPTQQVPAPADPSRDRFTPDAAGMVGPFSAMERAKFSAMQMVEGVKKWFSENWGKILIALIAIIGGAILLNILTGGAIMAALPIVMQLVSAYFAADALKNVAVYLGKYLSEAWPGNIGAGAKALARGLAIGAIELLFALLFGGKAAIKAVKNVAKTAAKSGVKGLAKGGMKLAKDGLKATAKNVKDLGKVALKGAKTAGQNVVKGGKFILKGVGNGFSKGAKKVKDLAKRLSKWTKFDRIKLVIKGKRWRLLGHMNPWVLMADGELVHVDPDQLKYKGKKPGATDDLLGRKVKVNGKNGIIVDADEIGKGAYTDHLLGAGKDSRKAAFEELDGIGRRSKRSSKVGSQTDEVADAIRQKRLEKEFEKLLASSDEFGADQVAAMKRALEMPDGDKVLEQFNWVRGIEFSEIEEAMKAQLKAKLKSIPTNASPEDLKRIASEIEALRATISDAHKVVPKGKVIKFEVPDPKKGTRTIEKEITETVDPQDLSKIKQELISKKELPSKEVNFMQNSISNATDGYFVLKNVLELIDGKLRKQFLGPIRTWVSATDGRVWTLDHRRLGAYKAAGIDNVPVKWANQGEVLGDATKMSTEIAQAGRSMKIRVFLDRNGKFVQKQVSGGKSVAFVLEETADGTIRILDDMGKVLTPEDIKNFLP